MSADALPIAPERFAAGLQELPLSTLHSMHLELRNQMAHLDYSNEQLRPFALGEVAAPGTPQGEPDRECADAIRENEVVIERIQERIRLMRAEVEERRGLSWSEFHSKGEAEAEAEATVAAAAAVAAEQAKARAAAGTNGVNGHAAEGAESSLEGQGQETERHSAWSDGTFTTGIIRPGQADNETVPGSRPGGGGTLADEEIRRRLEAQLGPLSDEDEDDNQGGLHL